MADVYATVADLEAYWRPLTSDEQTRADNLLVVASNSVRWYVLSKGGQIPSPPTAGIMADTLDWVCCDIVKRAMLSPIDQAPVNSQQVMAGSYQEMLTYANPSGDLYLTKQNKADLRAGLGLHGSVIGGLRPAIHSYDGSLVNGW
jgi:hypothetical protein